MQFKKAVAVAAVSAVASADSNNSTVISATAVPTNVPSGCSFSDFTATATADLQKVAACATAIGDVDIEGSQLGDVDLTGLHRLYGSLNINNVPKVGDIKAPDLEVVSKDLKVVNATILQNINLANLKTVGSLQLTSLSQLDKLLLTSGLTTADTVVIADTGLSSLEGINVFELKSLDVNNNPQIQQIKSELKRVTGALSLSYNSQDVDVSLDQLESVGDLNLQALKSFSAKNLTSVNGTLSVIGTSVKEVEFSKVSTIQKSLDIEQNENLQSVDFPQLTQVGGALSVGDNNDLKEIGNFPKLQQIGGSLNLTGSFNNGTFPALKRVAGGFSLDSDGSLTCDSFKKLNDNGVIKGDSFACKGKDVQTSSSSAKKGNSGGVNTDDASDISSDASATASSEASASESSSKGDKKNAASSMSGKHALFVAGCAAAGIALL